MNKKLVCILLSALLLCTLGVSVSAATFPDVTEETHAWAVEAIEEMVKDGIIKGYTDNTFKPDRTVTKTEALVLSARVAGFSSEDLAEYKAFAAEFYADVLEKYDTPYKNEIAFLLYKEVLTEKEVSFYIGGENANAGMKRYEVAKLLTRVMGADDDELDHEASTAEYVDSADIPADAKAYVRYVTDAELMNGMGDNKFGPMVDVTRAQISTLLYRLREKTMETYVLGSVKEVDSEMETITYIGADGEEDTAAVSVGTDPMIKQDGYSADFSRIALGADLLLTFRDDVLYAIDTITKTPDEVFEGAIASVTTTGGIAKIVVFPVGDEETQYTYTVSEEASITYEGSTASLKDLKRLQAVRLQIRDGEVVVVEATERERTIKGTIETIVLEPALTYGIRLTNGTVESYPVASSVVAKRNNTAVDADEILVGDKVTIVLRYEEVASVVATSSKFITQGTIEEIIIAKLPSIKIRANNAVSTYSLSRDCVYTVDGQKGDIYSLRLGASINASVDSETVTSLTSTAPSTTAAINGTIETINTSYGFFTLATLAEDGSTETMTIFTKRANLKIIDSADGSSKTTRDLKSGMKVSVTGVTSSGAYEATAIIIMSQDA